MVVAVRGRSPPLPTGALEYVHTTKCMLLASLLQQLDAAGVAVLCSYF
jgi:ABC-type transporter Mla MlaB component